MKNFVSRYLSTGINFSRLGFKFNIGRTTVGEIVWETCHAIWITLKEKEMPEPNEEMWLNIAENFYLKTNFPNCVGAIDGKHIRCTNMWGGDPRYSTRKKKCCIVLTAVADADLRFIAIDVGAIGKQGDSKVFRDSPLGKKLYSGSLNLPPPRCLPNTQKNPQPFVMVGDEAFRISTNLLRPYSVRGLNPTKRVFNYRLSRCRRSVEYAFGIMANKWRIFHRLIVVQPNFTDIIVKSCCVLHNFVCKRDGINYDDSETHPFDDVDDYGPCPRGRGLDVRENFAKYFMGIGAVSFQKNYMY